MSLFCITNARRLRDCLIFFLCTQVEMFVCSIADDKMPVISRLTLLSLCLAIYFMIKFRAREDSMLFRYVSWNEFLHNMLAKGEVGYPPFARYV